LKAETASPPSDDRRAQQRVFDLWRREYNHERPHEALQLQRPSRVYELSPRRYPRPFITPRQDPFSQVARVDKNGFIKWHRRNVFISSALKYEYVELDAGYDNHWTVRWGAIPPGRLDEHRPERGLIIARRRRGAKKVSGMSLL